MDIVKKRKENGQFYKTVQNLAKKNYYWSFDTFIIREMGFSFDGNEELEVVRRPAMREFRKRTARYPFASLPTIRKWFGIGDFSKPHRRQVFEICLVLHTGTDKAEEYLTMGLGESSFIYSDYHEMIFAYGLENHLSIDSCQRMIDEFEKGMIRKNQNRGRVEESVLEKQWADRKKDSPETFLHWMLENVEIFQGYSGWVVNCLYKAKEVVMNLARKEAEDRLEALLAETDFKAWLQRQGKKGGGLPDKKKLIVKYANQHRNGKYYRISKNMRAVILELCKIAYSEIDANTRLLAEVFGVSKHKITKKKEIDFTTIKKMTGKRLSDLFNIPVQQKRAIQVVRAKLLLKNMEREERCPKWVCQMCQNYSRNLVKLKNVGDALRWVNKFAIEHQRRCICIHRNDILPMAHYIAQHNYLQRTENISEEYDVEKARDEFVEVANRMLRECQMAQLDGGFEMDAVLLACYQPEEMFSFSDVLDVVEGMNGIV